MPIESLEFRDGRAAIELLMASYRRGVRLKWGVHANARIQPGSLMAPGQNGIREWEATTPVPMEEQIDQAEDGLHDWELIDRFDRLTKWRGEIQKRKADPARKDDGPVLLDWYAGKLQLRIRLEVQITIEQDFEFFTEVERKRTLREWFIQAPERIEYKKAWLYLPGTTIGKAREEISELRASIDTRAEEIATAISGVFGYTEHFEFWPILSNGEIARPAVPVLIPVSPPKSPKPAKKKGGDGGRFQRQITICILWLKTMMRELITKMLLGSSSSINGTYLLCFQKASELELEKPNLQVIYFNSLKSKRGKTARSISAIALSNIFQLLNAGTRKVKRHWPTMTLPHESSASACVKWNCRLRTTKSRRRNRRTNERFRSCDW